MTARSKRETDRRRSLTRVSRAEAWALVVPIFKRVPAYVRLSWALLRDKSIPQRHKTMLYFTIAYTFTPAHFLMAPIPIVSQLDSLVLLLLGIRQAIKHCPPRALEKHLERAKLPERQMEKDLHVTVAIGWQALSSIGRPVTQKAVFAGKVAQGFGRRLMRRLLHAAEAV